MSAFTGKGLQDVQARYGNRALHDQSESLFISSVSMRESIVFTITVSAPGGDNPRLLGRFSLLAKIQQCVKNLFSQKYNFCNQNPRESLDDTILQLS